MSNLDWIADPYGLQYGGEQEDQSEEISSFDERGCHTKYAANDREPASGRSRPCGRSPSPPGCAHAPRNKFPCSTPTPSPRASGSAPDPQGLWQDATTAKTAVTLRMIHQYLWQLTAPGEHDQSIIVTDPESADSSNTRALVLQALRRALLRESVSLRLLPQRSELDESGWGELLAQGLLCRPPQSA